jgi:hypothetical protein
MMGSTDLLSTLAQTMIFWVVSLALLLTFFIKIYRRVHANPNRTFDELVQYIRTVDLDSLRELIDVAGEGYLRLNLSRSSFRELQRSRVHLLQEFLKRMSHNARFLQDWAIAQCERSLSTQNHAARSSSKELIALCISFRLAARIAHFRLFVWSLQIKLLPFAPIPCLAEARLSHGTDWLYTYERIRETANALGVACDRRYAEKLVQVL